MQYRATGHRVGASLASAGLGYLTWATYLPVSEQHELLDQVVRLLGHVRAYAHRQAVRVQRKGDLSTRTMAHNHSTNHRPLRPVRCCSSATQSADMCTEGVNTEATFVLSSRSEPLSKRRCRTEAPHTNTAIRNTPQRQRRALHRANAGLTGEGPCIPAASLWRAPTAHECRRRSPPMRAPPHAAGRRAETARMCRRQRRRSQPARSHSRPSSTCG